MNFISTLKSQIYIVQSTFFRGTKNNNFVVCENTVDVRRQGRRDFFAASSLSGWCQACYTLCLFVLCSNSSHEVFRIVFFFSGKRKKNTIACLAVFTPLLNLDLMLISRMTTPSYLWPYGSLVPFKPTEPGSTMRNVRKPVIKPIEI